jgi:hypothetical protein
LTDRTQSILPAYKPHLLEADQEIPRRPPASENDKSGPKAALEDIQTDVPILERDDFSSKRHPVLVSWWSMIFSENRYPLFGIML